MKNSFSKFYEVFFEKGRFQLIQILGLLDMYFDTVVVRVNTFFTFIQIGSGHTLEESLIPFKIWNSGQIQELFDIC